MHKVTEDIASTLKDKIPASCLPSDLGGTLDTSDLIHKNFCEELVKLKDFFRAEEEQWNDKITTDLDDKFDTQCIEPTLENLEID